MKWQGRNEGSWGFVPACRAIYRRYSPLVTLWITKWKHQLRKKIGSAMQFKNKDLPITTNSSFTFTTPSVFLSIGRFGHAHSFFDYLWIWRSKKNFGQLTYLPWDVLSFFMQDTFSKITGPICKIFLIIIQMNNELPAKGLRERKRSMTSSFWATVKLLKASNSVNN